jgi:hypothetical protein
MSWIDRGVIWIQLLLCNIVQRTACDDDDLEFTLCYGVSKLITEPNESVSVTMDELVVQQCSLANATCGFMEQDVQLPVAAGPDS